MKYTCETIHEYEIIHVSIKYVTRSTQHGHGTNYLKKYQLHHMKWLGSSWPTFYELYKRTSRAVIGLRQSIGLWTYSFLDFVGWDLTGWCHGGHKLDHTQHNIGQMDCSQGRCIYYRTRISFPRSQQPHANLPIAPLDTLLLLASSDGMASSAITYPMALPSPISFFSRSGRWHGG